MKVLSDRFVLDPELTEAAMKHEEQRKIEARFERQKREIIGIKVLRSEVRLNPLDQALKGAGI